jgi:lysophospholipase L1-like esterase
MALSTAKKAVFGILTTAAVLTGLEVGAMWIAPHRPLTTGGAHSSETAMRASDILGWEAVPGPSRAFNVPGGTRIGAEGTRNPPPVEKPANGLRLLTLGDSTIYGVMIRDGEVFSDVAATTLGHALRRPVDALNGGIPGYSSEQARRLYERRLRAYKPDVVVIATLWSDSQLGPMPDAMLHPERGAALRRTLQHSALVRLMGGLLAGWVPGRDVAWKLSAEPGVRRVPPSGYRSNLRKLAALARSDGAEPVFLMLPCDRDVRRQPLEPPRPEYRDIMREVAADTHSLLVDGVTPFQSDPRGMGLMLDDVHPSTPGHRILGETLGQALVPLLSSHP